MISYLECYPCLVRQSLLTARLVSTDETLHRRVMNAVMKLLPELDPNSTPIRLAAPIHRLICSETGIDDPYKKIKQECNRFAIDRLPGLRDILDGSRNRLETALRIAIAGNIIDFGALGHDFDVDEAIKTSLQDPLGTDDLSKLWDQLSLAHKIVYVGDNAGEIVFDRLFIEEILRQYDLQISFVVRGAPILNDVTIEDAISSGLTDIVEILESGRAPGCELDRAPSAVTDAFKNADVILSKGQGNYEALSLEPYPIYFLLKVKCPVLAQDIGATLGSSIVKRSDNFRRKT